MSRTSWTYKSGLLLEFKPGCDTLCPPCDNLEAKLNRNRAVVESKGLDELWTKTKFFKRFDPNNQSTCIGYSKLEVARTNCVNQLTFKSSEKPIGHTNIQMDQYLYLYQIFLKKRFGCFEFEHVTYTVWMHTKDLGYAVDVEEAQANYRHSIMPAARIFRRLKKRSILCTNEVLTANSNHYKEYKTCSPRDCSKQNRHRHLLGTV